MREKEISEKNCIKYILFIEENSFLWGEFQLMMFHHHFPKSHKFPRKCYFVKSMIQEIRIKWTIPTFYYCVWLFWRKNKEKEVKLLRDAVQYIFINLLRWIFTFAASYFTWLPAFLSFLLFLLVFLITFFFHHLN